MAIPAASSPGSATFCSAANDPSPGRGLNIYRTFVDNAVTDTRESEPRTSKYQKGQSVDIILKDVSIRDIQFAGGGDDLEIYQYVGMTASGVKVLFTEGQVVYTTQRDPCNGAPAIV